MTKVYVVMTKSDGSDTIIECIKKTELSAYKFADNYAKIYKLNKYYEGMSWEFYGNDDTVMTVFDMELED